MNIQQELIQAQIALSQRRKNAEESLAFLKGLNLATTDPVLREAVHEAADSVADAYRTINAAKNGIAELTETFWKTNEIAPLLSDVYQWVYGDELITYSAAIRLLYDMDDTESIPNYRRVAVTNNLTILRDKETGRPNLSRYWDRRETLPNGKKNTYKGRVLRSEVLALKERWKNGESNCYSPAEPNPDRRKPKKSA